MMQQTVSAERGTRPRAVVRKVDHVLLKTDDARGLFTLFTRELALPTAWPLFHYMGCLSGAVAMGRVCVEMLQPLQETPVTELKRSGTRLIGVAFEPPTVTEAVAQLDARGLGHDPPAEYLNHDQRRWTSVPLAYWPEAPIRLLVKYARDQDARWDALQRELERNAGGPLGVCSLDEIVVGVRDRAAGLERWSALLDGSGAVSNERWKLREGPAVRVTGALRDGLSSLVVRVRDLDAAAASLQARGMLAARFDDEVHMRFTPDQDVSLRLRQGAR